MRVSLSISREPRELGGCELREYGRIARFLAVDLASCSSSTRRGMSASSIVPSTMECEARICSINGRARAGQADR